MYKGELAGFPQEIVEKMLEYQVEQGNVRNVTVFENSVTSGASSGGFKWSAAPEGRSFWDGVINNKNFKLFFNKYPKIKVEEVDEDEMLFNLANEHLTNKQIKRLYSNRFGKN